MALQNDLPPEVLANIFMHCLDGGPVKILPRSPRNESPWALSAVCSRWRSIAHGYQPLWTNVWADPGVTTNRKFHEVLSRSGKLSISLSGRRIFDGLPPKHYTRVRSLTMIDAEPKTLWRLGFLTILEFLHLNYTVLYTSPDSLLKKVHLPATLQVFHFTCYALQYLPLHLLGLGPESSVWGHLTDISITLDLLDARQILPRCHELVKCKMTIGRPHTDIIRNKNPTIIPKLQSFIIQPEQDTLGPLLESLTLPSLTYLEINGRSTHPWPEGEVLGLIGRSKCRLTHFMCMGDSEMPLTRVLDLMRAMPDLITYDTEVEEPATNDFFDAIQAEDLVPALEELHITVDGVSAALEFLHRRWAMGPGRGIRRGVIYIRKEVIDKQGAEVAELEAAMVEMGTEMTVNPVSSFW